MAISKATMKDRKIALLAANLLPKPLSDLLLFPFIGKPPSAISPRDRKMIHFQRSCVQAFNNNMEAYNVDRPGVAHRSRQFLEPNPCDLKTHNSQAGRTRTEGFRLECQGDTALRNHSDLFAIAENLQASLAGGTQRHERSGLIGQRNQQIDWQERRLANLHMLPILIAAFVEFIVGGNIRYRLGGDMGDGLGGP